VVLRVGAREVEQMPAAPRLRRLEPLDDKALAADPLDGPFGGRDDHLGVVDLDDRRP
jgi:hypothetical protein